MVRVSAVTFGSTPPKPLLITPNRIVLVDPILQAFGKKR
jgi:hypothetical protein